jgi:hypothetical protein
VTAPAPPGFTYHVGDAQLAAFRTRTPAQRLRWLEEARELSIRLASDEAKRWWRRFRAR